MLNINLKSENGIFNEVKLIDAFTNLNGITFVITYNNETENNLLKIYISKYDDNKLKGISEEEWNQVKKDLAEIIKGTAKFELVELPSFIEVVGPLKPCLIASIDFFENHYKSVSEKSTSPFMEDDSKFRFTNGDHEWHREEKDLESEDKESLSSIVSKANALTLEENGNRDSEQKDRDKLIESTDYKSQKTNFLNLVSRALDEILESKNKEVVDLKNLVEKLESDLRKTELEKRQALNIINMYHNKIKKLDEAIREGKEGYNG